MTTTTTRSASVCRWGCRICSTTCRWIFLSRSDRPLTSRRTSRGKSPVASAFVTGSDEDPANVKRKEQHENDQINRLDGRLCGGSDGDGGVPCVGGSGGDSGPAGKKLHGHGCI